MTLILILANMLIISSTITCGKKEYYEKEPNHFLNNANPIKLNQNIKGNFQNIKDKDSFILNLKKEKKEKINVQITLTKIKGYDIAFDIYEGNKLIKNIDDYRKSKNETINSIILTNKIYYIIVKISPLHSIFYKQIINNIKTKQFPSTNYSLTIKTQPIKPFYELETNDTINNANHIKINTFIEGSFSPLYNLNRIKNNTPFNNKKLNSLIQKLEHDWYYIDLNNEGQFKLSITLEVTSNIDAILGIYNKTFNKLVNNKKTGENESIINLSVNGKQRYYILVSGMPHAYKINDKENYSYRLNVNINPNNIPTEAEPNNNISKANIITDNIIYGILSPENDKDFYIIKLIKNSNINTKNQKLENQNTKTNKIKTLSVSLSPVRNIDLALHIYDKYENLIRIYDNNNINQGENIQNFNVTNLTQIILCVKGGYHNKTDNYKESYILKTKIKEHKPNYELEANDNINTDTKIHMPYQKINKIKPNTTIYGYINGKNPHQQNDIDNFEVKLKHNTNYKVKLKGIQGLDIKLSIYYRDKSPVHNFNIIKSTNDTIQNSTLKVPYDPFDPDSNIYNIKIETEFTNKGNSNKTYSFILQELPKVNN